MKNNRYEKVKKVLRVRFYGKSYSMVVIYLTILFLILLDIFFKRGGMKSLNNIFRIQVHVLYTLMHVAV